MKTIFSHRMNLFIYNHYDWMLKVSALRPCLIQVARKCKSFTVGCGQWSQATIQADRGAKFCPPVDRKRRGETIKYYPFTLALSPLISTNFRPSTFGCSTERETK